MGLDEAAIQHRRHGSPGRVLSLRATFEAVRATASDRGWTVIRGTMGDDGNPELEAALSIRRSFLMLIMVVQADLGEFLVADAGTVASDERSLGLVARADVSAFDERGLDRVRRFAAENSAHWRGKSFAGHRTASVARQPSDVVHDASTYRRLLENGINRLFGGEPA